MACDQLLCVDPQNCEMRRFLVDPRGCEISGLAWNLDGKALWANIPASAPRLRWQNSPVLDSRPLC